MVLCGGDTEVVIVDMIGSYSDGGDEKCSRYCVESDDYDSKSGEMGISNLHSD